MLSLIFFALLNLLPSFSFDMVILLIYSIAMLIYSIIQRINTDNNKKTLIRVFNEETYIYDREFKNYGISQIDYREIIMKKAILKRTTDYKYTFTSEDNEASKVYLFISIPYDAQIVLSIKKNPIFKIEESSWVGAVELIQRYYSHQKNSLYNTTMELNNPINKEIVWIEWNTSDLLAFLHKQSNSLLETKLLFIWANYLYKIILSLNGYIIQSEHIKSGITPH